MHRHSSSLLLGLIGLLLGTILGMDQHLPAHFGQRLRREPAIILTSSQKKLLQKLVQKPQSLRLHRAASEQSFPTADPVSSIPNWGAFETPSRWNRPYDTIPSDDLVPVPAYDLSVLTFPMRALDAKDPDNIPLITAKLYYSTRFFSRYDLDAGEFTGPHAGIDLKLPYGTPFSAIADGTVHAVRRDDRLGLFVIVQHHHPTEGPLFSIYGHLGDTALKAGQSVRAGDHIGTVGTTGQTSGPHLHLQIDRPTKSGGTHTPFITYAVPLPEEVDQWTLHPIRFIEEN